MEPFAPAPFSAPLRERLLAFPFLRGLARESFERLAASCESLVVPQGQHLLDEGALCEALLLVERGHIRVYKSAPTGREITLYRVEPGESCLLGTACLLSGEHYPAQAATLEEMNALAVPAQVFRSLFGREQGVQGFVVDLFSRRFVDLMVLVDEVVFRRMDERLSGFLLAEARKAPGALYPVEMTHEEIAAHLGTAREVVSRLLAQFETEGLVALGRRLVRVKDAPALSRRAGAPT